MSVFCNITKDYIHRQNISFTRNLYSILKYTSDLWYLAGLIGIKHLCLCGCGQEVDNDKNRFINGHVLMEVRIRAGRKGGYALHRLHPHLASQMGKLTGPTNIRQAQIWRLNNPKRVHEIAVLAGLSGGPKGGRKRMELLDEKGRRELAASGGRAAGPVNGPKNIHYALEQLDIHPEIRQDNARRLNEFLNHTDIRQKNGRKNVESGKIFESQHGTFVWHDPTELLTIRHFHRSKKELNDCIKEQQKYPKDWLHTNVRFIVEGIGGCELDFIISDPMIFNPKDPSTWLKIIEYHTIRTWEGETAETYISKRIIKISSFNILCDIEVLCE